jgi:protein-export membrane protein SecD
MAEALRRLRELAAPLASALLSGGAQDLEVSEGEDQRIEVRLVPQAIQEIKAAAVSQSIEIVRRRIDELGTREPTIQRQGLERIIVQVPGESDPQRILGLLRTTAKMNFHMVDTTVTISEAIAGRVPPGSLLLPSEDATEQFVLVYRQAAITGDRLTNSGVSTDQQTGEPVVTFRFDSAGARRFADLSRDNVGRRFAIVLDNVVISAPVIREPILGGSGQISGNFTFETANNLSILLRSGALPAPVTPLEQRSVGPDLGADSIAAGQMAALIGFAAVIVFMVVCYSLFGLLANIALILNIILIAGALSLLGATLTLPGVAGVVLTIGMAVDANVLIFERIREEVVAGKSPINAVEAGYSRALGTILDANITTLIAAIILFWLGSGPVRGFSVTLAIGIVTSVFTAFTVTRLFVVTWLRRQHKPVLPI